MNGADAVGADPWLEEFLGAYYRRRPVYATFIGVHEYDHRLPDQSSTGVADVVSEMRALLDRAERARPPAGPLAAIDRRLAEGFLRIQLSEYESRHFLSNPSTHAGEAVFGMMSLVLSDSLPRADRLGALAARMRALPEFLDQARSHLDSAPRAWTYRAMRECRGGRAFIRDSVVHLDSSLGEAAKSA